MTVLIMNILDDIFEAAKCAAIHPLQKDKQQIYSEKGIQAAAQTEYKIPMLMQPFGVMTACDAL